MTTTTTTTTTQPSTTCTGTSLTPGMDVRTVINGAPGGTTFCFQPGTYVVGGYITPQSYDKLISVSPRGAILTGNHTYNGGIWGSGGPTGQHDVLIQGFVIEQFANTWGTNPRSALQTGWSWDLENNELAYNSEAGTEFNDGDTVHGNFIHDNGRYGFVGGPTTNVMIDSNELSNNNTAHYDLGDAGGSKIVGSQSGTTYVIFSNNYVHDNYGMGLWCDGNCKYITYKNNRVVNNGGVGIDHEISWDATITGNTVTNNGSLDANQSCYWGNIEMNDSTNVEVYGNTVSDALGANGICAADIARTDGSAFSQQVLNLYVHDNTIYMTTASDSGLVGRPSAFQSSANNRFVHNTYYVPDLSGAYWDWSTYPLTWSGWHGVGQDLTGALYSG